MRVQPNFPIGGGVRLYSVPVLRARSGPGRLGPGLGLGARAVAAFIAPAHIRMPSAHSRNQQPQPGPSGRKAALTPRRCRPIRPITPPRPPRGSHSWTFGLREDCDGSEPLVQPGLRHGGWLGVDAVPESTTTHNAFVSLAWVITVTFWCLAALVTEVVAAITIMSNLDPEKLEARAHG
jgi:hypothetical protein